MSQSFVKIMKSSKREEKQFMLIPVETGDIVEFMNTPNNHLLLNGVVHCEINGTAYMMNSEGKTIATFEPTPPVTREAVRLGRYIAYAVNEEMSPKHTAVYPSDGYSRGAVACTFIDPKSVDFGGDIIDFMEHHVGGLGNSMFIQLEKNAELAHGIHGYVCFPITESDGSTRIQYGILKQPITTISVIDTDYQSFQAKTHAMVHPLHPEN